MTESGKNERWNSLLETLGVPVSEPPKEQVTPQPPTEAAPSKPQPMSMLPPQKQKPAPKPKAAPPAAKSPSYWSRIAGALGLDVGSATAPAVEEPKVQKIEEPRSEPEPERRHRAPSREREAPPRSFDRPRREDRRPHEERPREERPRHEDRTSEEPSGRPALDDMFRTKPSDVDVFSLGGEQPRMREPMESPPREDEERGSVLDYDVPEGSGSDLALGRAAAGEASRQEESGREEEPGRDGHRRRRRRGRGRRGRGEFREGGPPPQQREADIEPAGEEADFDMERDDVMELEAEFGPEPATPTDEPKGGSWRERDEEPQRYASSGERQPRDRGDERGNERGGRGRRGRGRGRGRDRDRGAGDRGTSDRTAGDRTAGDRAAGDRPGAYRGEGPPRMGPPRDQTARVEEDEIDDELSAEMEEADESRGGDVPTHKKIPTWEEAVNMLIDANMANRGPERDRGYGRGRGRGRG